MFEDINGNIGAVTRHGRRLTWTRMYLYEGCYQDPEVVACYATCAEGIVRGNWLESARCAL